MIRIVLSDMQYKLDIYNILKAIYPDETFDFIEGTTKEKIDKYIDSQTTSALKVETKSSKITIEYIYYKTSKWKELEFSIDIGPEITTKSQYKNAMKRQLYKILKKVSGRLLPWGILTGIRPTKIVYEKIEEGYDDKEITSYMQDEFMCSDDRIRLSLDIAKRELSLLEDMDYKNGYSLYIGVPFCPSTCLYCSFSSFSMEKHGKYVDDYLKALEKEIEYGGRALPDKSLKTVYIGGGTPTTLSESQLDWLLGKLKRDFDFSSVKEFSVEAGRPDSISKGKLQVLKKHGVNRISINPQSMNQKTLDLIGRKHTKDNIIEAFQLARETGHDNINMDLIIGLPGEGLEDVKRTLSEIEKLDPDSLTVHTLAIKRAARLNHEKDNYQDLRSGDVSSIMDETINYAKRHNYLPYYLYRQKNMADNLENIGYARYGKEGLYNILIMEEQQTILALGAGAVSKFVLHDEGDDNKVHRVYNVKGINEYISRIDEMIERKKDFIEDEFYLED